MQFLKDLFHLFYPKLCVVCKHQLIENENILCVYCRHDLPIVCEKNYRDNKITAIFKGRIPIEKGMSLFYFRKKGKVKELIHQLKYKGNQEIGTFIGNWFGEILHESNQFKNIDYIIPVPLHQKKLKQRGYNQVTKFGEVLSKKLTTPYKEGILTRTSATETQTFRQRFDRFKNVNTAFSLTNTSCFKDKHILLIDDVVTTGATLEACCKELLKTEGIKISIVTMTIAE